MPALLLNRYVIGAALAVALVLGAYLKGYSSGYHKADQGARIAALESELAAARQDLDAQRRAAELSRQAAAENQRTAAAAQQRVADYEAELQKRGDAGRCSLSDGDLEWLSKRGPAAGPAGHAGR